MPFNFHNQAATKILYEHGEADHIHNQDPIFMDEMDDSYFDVTLKVKTWAHSKFRDWAKKCKRDNAVNIELTVITSSGEKYLLEGGRVINTGGFITGGMECIEHLLVFKFNKVTPVTDC